MDWTCRFLQFKDLKMHKSYIIDAVLEEFPGRCGWLLFCFEDDDCVWEQFFATKNEAEIFGEDWVNGLFREGFPISETKNVG